MRRPGYGRDPFSLTCSGCASLTCPHASRPWPKRLRTRDLYEGWAEKDKTATPARLSLLRPELANWKGLDELVLRPLAKDRHQRCPMSQRNSAFLMQCSTLLPGSRLPETRRSAMYSCLQPRTRKLGMKGWEKQMPERDLLTACLNPGAEHWSRSLTIRMAAAGASLVVLCFVVFAALGRHGKTVNPPPPPPPPPASLLVTCNLSCDLTVNGQKPQRNADGQISLPAETAAFIRVWPIGRWAEPQTRTVIPSPGPDTKRAV